MKAFVAVTDRQWFEFLRNRPGLSEVNFWQPSGSSQFQALAPGQPLLFKLHYPTNRIVGGGFFATFSILPVSLAWEMFGEANGAGTLLQMRERIIQYRRAQADPHEDYKIGCIVLEDAFFFDEASWLPPPADFSPNVVRGKGYDLTQGAGLALWDSVLQTRALQAHLGNEPRTSSMYGASAMFRPRLGQGAFRVGVTDAYQRRCAVTGERTLPVLEAAHIKPVSKGGEHRIDNGLLLRSDIHTLFDRGYVTVAQDFTFKVSDRLRHDWRNGRIYYELSEKTLAVPDDASLRPSQADLAWHHREVFMA